MAGITAGLRSFRLDDFTEEEEEEGTAAQESQASQALTLQKLQLQGAPAGAAAAAAAAAVSTAAAAAVSTAAAAAAGAGDEEGYEDDDICIKVVSRPGFTCAIQASARLGMAPRQLFKQIITHPGRHACPPACRVPPCTDCISEERGVLQAVVGSCSSAALLTPVPSLCMPLAGPLPPPPMQTTPRCSAT